MTQSSLQAMKRFSRIVAGELASLEDGVFSDRAFGRSGRQSHCGSRACWNLHASRCSHKLLKSLECPRRELRVSPSDCDDKGASMRRSFCRIHLAAREMGVSRSPSILWRRHFGTTFPNGCHIAESRSMDTARHRSRDIRGRRPGTRHHATPGRRPVHAAYAGA